MPENTPDHLTILGLEAENYKRLRLVQVQPHPAGAIVVAGENAQGKTSVLDSIMHTLGGASAVPGTSNPVNTDSPDGKAHLRVDLGDITVTRRFAPGGKTTLVVEDADGKRRRSPQGILDALLGKISFDPLAFTRATPAEQVRTIMELVPSFDYDGYTTERKVAYEERTLAGRAARQAAAALKGTTPPPPGTPDELVDTAALTEELTDIADQNSRVEAARDRRAAIASRIADLRAQIAELEAEAEDLEEVAAQPFVDAAPVRTKLLAASDTNAAVQAATEYRAAEARAKETEREHARWDNRVAELDKGLRTALAAADLPIEGLGFDPDGAGITYNGQPFGQASGAEQLRVSLAVAMALNPKLRVVLVRDGSLLDAHSLELVDKMARANGYQVWLERVDSTGSTGIVIEDGTVARNNYDEEGGQ